jgi:pSer/pThr/pTyr-binding forkhead associated (FHA) protein
MSQLQLELEVIGGPDKGRIFRVTGNATIVGRDADCHIRLNDATVSAKHARIELGDTAQIVDLGSINKLQHNGQTVTKAILHEGDRIGVGDTVIEISLKTASPLDMQKTLKTGRRRGTLIILTVSVLVLLGFVYYGLQYQKDKALRETPLQIETMRPISTSGFPGLSKVNLPTAGDYSVAPTNRYGPVDSNGRIPRHAFYSFMAPKAGKKGGYQERADLNTASVLPPDPLSNGTFKARNWSNFSPRIGNGRLLKNEQAVLGYYYMGKVDYRNDMLYNEAPKALVGQKIGFDAPVTDVTPLQFEFMVEVWDALPRGAVIQNFSLDLKSSDERFNTKALVPKLYGGTIDRRYWTKQDGTQQWAEFTQSIKDTPYAHYIVRQEKQGEILVIFTARCFAWQQDRVEAAMKSLIEKQSLTEYKRRDDDATLLENALKLEKEADAMIPGLMEYKPGEMEYYKEKWNFFRAFNRYHKALCLLQAIDKWSYDDDYVRVFAKAEKIYDYVQAENTFFIRTWKEIEKELDKRAWKEAQKKNKDLYEFTTLGMEPDLFPFLDEWFIYSHLVREKVARNLSVEE